MKYAEAEVERLTTALRLSETRLLNAGEDVLTFGARAARLTEALREIAEARGTLIKTDVDSAAVTLLILIARRALEESSG